MWGLPNYQPCFVETTGEVLNLCRELAPEVVGKPIGKVWTAWLRRDNVWWDDAPVVVEIGGTGYEFCWMKEAHLALTRNSIDVSASFRWFEAEELVIDWRPNALSELDIISGQIITGLEAMESRFKARLSDRVHTRDVPNAVDFLFGTERVSVYNAFDRNGISMERIEAEGVRYIEV
jgi:hypothetical protein